MHAHACTAWKYEVAIARTSSTLLSIYCMHVAAFSRHSLRLLSPKSVVFLYIHAYRATGYKIICTTAAINFCFLAPNPRHKVNQINLLHAIGAKN